MFPHKAKVYIITHYLKETANRIYRDSLSPPHGGKKTSDFLCLQVFSCLQQKQTPLSIATLLGKLQKITQWVALATIITLNLGPFLWEMPEVYMKNIKALSCQSQRREASSEHKVQTPFVNTDHGASRVIKDIYRCIKHTNVVTMLGTHLQQERQEISIISFYVLNTRSRV